MFGSPTAWRPANAFPLRLDARSTKCTRWTAARSPWGRRRCPKRAECIRRSGRQPAMGEAALPLWTLSAPHPRPGGPPGDTVRKESRDTPPVAGGVPAPNQAEENAGTARNEQRLARPGRTGLSTSPALPLVVASATRAAPPWPAEAARPHGQPGCGGHRRPPGRCDHGAPTTSGGRCRSGDRSPRTPAEELCAPSTPVPLRYPTSHGAHPIPG